MYICKNVLSTEEVEQIVSYLDTIKWDAGKTNLDKSHKDNNEHTNQNFGEQILEKIMSHPTVVQCAFITNITTPRFNLYENSGHYNKHVDFAFQEGIRTDWSMTLFLSNKKDYEGGELVIEGLSPEPYKYKGEAGDMILYPSGKLHYVTPVTKGKRIAAIAWAQSEIANLENRLILAKLSTTISELQDKAELKEQIVNLSYVYNNLLREWS